jgi:tetratricopeptide (TPR) repeat protein
VIGRFLLLTFGMLAAGGCMQLRMVRENPELEESVRAGRPERTAELERKLLASADAEGPQSLAAVRARVSIARSYAQWKLTDRALSLARETVDRLDPAAANQAIVPALLGLADIQLYAHLWDEAEKTTDRVVEICAAAPLHVPTADEPYDQCYFARFHVDDHYLNAGNVEKFAQRYLLPENESDATDRDAALSKLTVLGRGYARYGRYPEATWYLRRCVEENRPGYSNLGAPPPVRQVGSTASGDVEVFTLDWAHSFHSQSPRCLEDLIELRRIVGDEKEASELERWQRHLWAQGPDLESALVENMRKSDRQWHHGFTTSHDANNLAFYYAGKGRTHDAIRMYREAITLIDEQRAKDGVFGDVQPVGMLLDELLGLGAACEEAALTGEALAAYERALDLADRELHPRHRWRLESRAGRARSLLALGRFAEAAAAWREYLTTAEAIRADDHPDYATGLDGLAAATDDRDPREAKRLRRRAEEIRSIARARVDAVRDLPVFAALRSPALPVN